MNKSLIANSGIQFIEINLSIQHDTPLLKKKKALAEMVYKDSDNEEVEVVFPYYRGDTGEFVIKDAINKDAFDRDGRIDEEKILADYSLPIDEERIYKVSYQEALDIYEETWLPVPFLNSNFRGEKDEDTLDFGPLCWARMYIAKLAPGRGEPNDTHTLVLAFDTSVRDPFEETFYENLRYEDTTSGGEIKFRTPKSDEFISNFYSQEWVQDWLEDIFQTRVESGVYQDKGKFFSKFACAYLALIGMLNELKAFPVIKVFNSDERSIDVSLVLDIGNSRTCGLILETSEVGREQFDTKKAQRLKIRDLSTPNRTYDRPFDMKVAFTEQVFGDEEFTKAVTENKQFFLWPSLVRVGPEATRLIALNGNDQDAQFYLSSPKRYLWDTMPNEIPWKSVRINTRGRLAFQEVFYGISHSFTESGKLIVYKPEGVDRITKVNGRYNLDYTQNGTPVLKDEIRYRKKQTEVPIPAPGSPKYARSSLMTFTIFELLLHALSQVNSHEYRALLNHESVARRLKNLVLTCPTAMSETDQRQLRNAADDAIDLLKIYFDETFIDEDLKIIPEPVNTTREAEEPANWMYDEATCSHLAFLYGEIDYRFNGEAVKYFDVCGKQNRALQFGNEKSITIASIDIGGGTTDVMICAYQIDPESNGELIIPQPFFWEGFNLAGDDIMRSIIERSILPQIYDFAVKRGCSRTQAKAVMSDLFGPHTGERFNIKEVRLKNLAVNQLITPIVYAFIEHLTENKASDSFKFDDFFYDYPRPSKEVIQQINDKFTRAGATRFNIERMVWQVEVSALNDDILKEIGKLLTHISAIIAQYECDTVLLAGKPTKIPVLKELMVRNLPVSPDRIVTLGNYRIGNWYPFSDSHHMMNDPKTIVCVGAAISHMSEMGRLGRFRFNTEPLKVVKSTANFIGKYTQNSARIKKEEVFLSAGEDTGKIKFSGADLLIGKRQLADSNWRAAPIYQIKLKDKNSAQQLRNRMLEAPYTISVERSAFSKEELNYDIIAEDRNGNEFNFDDYFILTPQSLQDEFGYWLDTGCFSLNILKD
ncbi:virulence factor SrfB [Lewinella sp. LCG006]|uniref:virulence factor SrfB n=1 Tax=Lewinella sp. LCG006 TaxID=3231911 RepID=UPI00345FEF65